MFGQRFENVLVCAPHTDDGELGAGGFISRLIDEGSSVTYVAFSAAEESVPDGFPRDVLRSEVRLATSTLGVDPANLEVLGYPVRRFDQHRQEILEDLVRIKRGLNPDLILIPSSTDIHQDHSVIHQEGVRAFKGQTILGYEVLWNNLSFHADFFVKLPKERILRKCAALQAYTSQKDRSYMSEEFIVGLARTRGVQIGAEYAESFEVVRWVIN